MRNRKAKHQLNPFLTLREAEQAILGSLRANVPLLLRGPPGIGKTSIIRSVCSSEGLECHVLLGALLEPVDVGGIPIVSRDKQQILRLPLGVVREVCERPGVLFIDELNLASEPVQGAMLRGVHEGAFGDARLHRDSRVLLAANPSHQVVGSSEIMGPLVNRVSIVDARPSVEEVEDFFQRVGTPDSTLARLARTFVGMLERTPSLLQFDPPPVSTPSPWGSPRAWHRGLELLAALLDATDVEKPVLEQALAGCVGPELARAFLVSHERIPRGPSLKEILESPATVPTPSNADEEADALSLLREVSRRDAAAAWIYGSRLGGELAAMAFGVLKKVRITSRPRTERERDAVLARRRLTSAFGASMAGRS